MRHRHRMVATVAVAGMLLVGCGGGGENIDKTAAGRVEPGETSTVPSTDPAAGDPGAAGGHMASEWSFADSDGDEDLSIEPGSPDEPVAFGDAPPPDGTDEAHVEEIGRRFWNPEDPSAPAGLRLEDPCTLVTADEFRAWAGTELAGSPVVLEDGEACGFIAGGDRLRMAIGAVPVSTEEQRFLPAAGGDLEPADIHPVQGVTAPMPAKRIVWVPHYPVVDSNLLVFEGDGFDLVVEMSSRDGRSADSLRDGAAHFATLALGRLS